VVSGQWWRSSFFTGTPAIWDTRCAGDAKFRVVWGGEEGIDDGGDFDFWDMGSVPDHFRNGWPARPVSVSPWAWLRGKHNAPAVGHGDGLRAFGEGLLDHFGEAFLGVVKPPAGYGLGLRKTMSNVYT